MTTSSRRLSPLKWTDVRIDDAFWSPKIEVNRATTLPREYELCKSTGRINAFKLDWKPGQPNPPHIFWDSDVAKWIEAAAYSVATRPDPALEAMLNDVADLVASAGRPDGYLNCHYTVVEPGKRWSNLRDCHELYCAGHLIEGAVAHFQATGKRTLLDALCRYADYIDSVFGTEPGKIRGYCGHEEIELALVKLYRATGQNRYLNLAKYFIDERGRQPHYFDLEAQVRCEDPTKHWTGGKYEYLQAHLPVREQPEVVGHAVRAMYLLSGMADVAAETGDATLLAACRRLWNDTAARKMYVTGAVGALHNGEAFGRPYELPNESAYAETCANIALAFFAHRMVQLEADAKYADVMERALYNGMLSGVSADGMKFFYVNPLASAGGHHRQDWFGCACCPPNIARLLASMGQYIYSTSDQAAYVHLYIGSETKLNIAGRAVAIRQQTDYPWAGRVELVIDADAPAKFDLMLRIPAWCRKHRLALNGKPLKAPIAKGYAQIRRTWAGGDVVELSLDMPIERVAAHPAVADNAGRVALQRGPIVYCLEQCDNRADVRAMLLPDSAKLTARFDRKLLGGAVVIEGTGRTPDADDGSLYRDARSLKTTPVKFKAIPYFLWDNRKPGKMTVWLPRG
ncbi:MAG: glycoside hydrolase family 127 protein [Phycisphaerae bacterium]|nr:glycoside hydrolase family 127 protein [Phycisphaerae bacterium]